jgi:UDP-glucuronate 4-epimerase
MTTADPIPVQAVGEPAVRDLVPMQPGDVSETCADVGDLAAAAGFAPKTPIEEGIGRFVEWYREYTER